MSKEELESLLAELEAKHQLLTIAIGGRDKPTIYSRAAQAIRELLAAVPK